jgi:hypothetical protein
MSNTHNLPSHPQAFLDHIERTPGWEATVEVKEIERSIFAHDRHGDLIFTDDGLKHHVTSIRSISITATRLIGEYGSNEVVHGHWMTTVHPISGKETDRTKFLGGSTYGSWMSFRNVKSARELFYNLYDHSQYAGTNG